MTPSGKNDSTLSVQVSEATGEVVETQPKRKRGRPRKVRTEGEVSAVTKKTTTSRHSGVAVPKGTAWDALENPEKYALPPQGRGYAAQHAEVLRSEMPREQTNVRIRSELKRAAQVVAVTRGMSLGDVIEEALIDYLKQHGRSVLDEHS